MDELDAFDVVVLGAGSGGEAVARDLAAAGRAVAVVEKWLVGGECPFTACMPSKAVLHGVAAGWPWERVRAHRDHVTARGDDSGHVADLEGHGVTVLRGRGEVLGPGRLRLDTGNGRRDLAWHELVLATGAGVVVPEVDGIDAVQWWDSEALWTADELPGSLLVLGGGPVGLEVATATGGLGHRTVLVDHGDVLVDGLPEADDVLLAAFAAGPVEVHQRSTLRAVEPRSGGGVVGTLEDGTQVVADRLVLATGKQPRVTGIGLEQLGIVPEELDVDLTGRVAGADHVWAVGDVTGMPAFTHTANHVAAVVADNILGGGQRRAELAATPRGMFTAPPVVVVGDLAPTDGCVRVTVSYDDGARPSTDLTGPGVLALQARADGTVVGVGGVGETVDELASAWTLMVALELTVQDVARVQQQFPTHGELTKLLAERAAAVLR